MGEPGATGGLDRTAIGRIFREESGRSIASLIRTFGDIDLAEDAVQEAFVAVWRTAAAFRAERGGARAWILTLVHRRAVDRVRREQRHADLAAGSMPEHEAAPETGASADQLHVRAALASLSPAERNVIGLAYYEGLTQEQVAAALGIPVGTVKSRTARALARLASRLGDRARTELSDAIAV